VVPAIASFFSGVVNWHKNVVKLKDLTYEELKGAILVKELP